MSELDESIAHRDAERAIELWLRDKLQKHFAEVYDFDHLVNFIRITGHQTDWNSLIEKLSLLGLRQILIQLIEERVPLGRRGDFLDELQLLGRRVTDPFRLIQLLREHLATGICREFADERGQLLVVLLDEDLENTLVPWVPEEFHLPLPLDPKSALELSGAVRRTTSLCLAEHDALPVIVCDTELRLALYRMLQNYSRSFYVLSYDELSSEVPIVTAGSIRQSDVPSLEN